MQFNKDEIEFAINEICDKANQISDLIKDIKAIGKRYNEAISQAEYEDRAYLKEHNKCFKYFNNATDLFQPMILGSLKCAPEDPCPKLSIESFDDVDVNLNMTTSAIQLWLKSVRRTRGITSRGYGIYIKLYNTSGDVITKHNFEYLGNVNKRNVTRFIKDNLYRYPYRATLEHVSSDVEIWKTTHEDTLVKGSFNTL